MKIAILAPFYPFRGGLAQLNAHLYNQLSVRNEVKAFNFTTLYPNILFPGKTQFVQPQDSPTIVDSERILNSVNPFSYIKTAKRINKYKPDILIIPYWISFLAPALGTILRLLDSNIKVISLVHNAIPHEKHFFDVPFNRFFFKKCDALIVMSEAVQKDLLKLTPNANILQHPHPIYEQYKERYDKKTACDELEIDLQKKNLLFFGLIRDYKGLDILIEAMNYLDDSYQLIIAGESYGDFEKYQSLINNSKHKDNIKVLEQYIPDDMVTTLFSASDLLILPYRSATQSGVIALAYQLELPMVVTNVGALGDTIRTANTGLVVDEPTPQKIAKGIQTYFEEKDHTQYIENIRTEKKRLSWESFVRSIEEFTKTI